MAQASNINNPTKRLFISTLDGTVSGYVTTLLVPNGTLTDNGSGIFTLSIGLTNYLLYETGVALQLESNGFLELE